MKLISIAGVVVATVLAAASTPAPLAAAGAQEKVTLTGCAVKGNGDGDGFLLANAVEQTTRTTVTPDQSGSRVSATSTTTSEMKPARILYWLDDDDDVVEKLMGQLVEITGEVEGDVKRGEIEVERENGMIELEIKADGRKANVKLADVPSAIGTSGSVKDHEKDLPYVVRKLDVKSAKSIGATCQ
jgi:hypothetical protein